MGRLCPPLFELPFGFPEPGAGLSERRQVAGLGANFSIPASRSAGSLWGFKPSPSLFVPARGDGYLNHLEPGLGTWGTPRLRAEIQQF